MIVFKCPGGIACLCLLNPATAALFLRYIRTIATHQVQAKCKKKHTHWLRAISKARHTSTVSCTAKIATNTG